MHVRTACILYVSVFLATGCSSLQLQNAGNYAQLALYRQQGVHPENLKHKLYNLFHEWQGVRYQLGGLSKQGIDCSGFVYVTYKSALDMELPRTTRLQSQLGSAVSKKNLQTGDLVFFKTGKATRHVGIYLEKNKFLHASLSQGVTISRLDNHYWHANYWKAIRI